MKAYLAGGEERTSPTQSQYSPWGCLQCRCNLREWSGSSPAPGCPPCFQSRSESSAVVQEVPQEQATDGRSEESTEWHQCLRIASESCCFITATPISAARPAFSERRQRTDGLSEEPFQTSLSKQTQPTESKPSCASSSS